MCVPLIRQGEILGLIHVDSQARGKYTRNDLDLLTKVAMHATIVIENARFYKARQEFNRNLFSAFRSDQKPFFLFETRLDRQRCYRLCRPNFSCQKTATCF